MTSFEAALRGMNACSTAIEWVGARTLDRAWAECERGDWMLWLAVRRLPDRRPVVLAACACARLALPHVPAGEDRPRIAVETAERWARGEAAIEEVRHAAYAVHAAARAADAYAAAAAADAYAARAAAHAAYATYAAAHAAYATYAAAHAARAAAHAAAYAAYAAADAVHAAAYAEREDVLLECARIVREMIPLGLIESSCYFCPGHAGLELEEAPRPLAEAEAGRHYLDFSGMQVANACCPDCGAKSAEPAREATPFIRGIRYEQARTAISLLSDLRSMIELPQEDKDSIGALFPVLLRLKDRLRGAP